jgi:hypothetical protein
MAEPIGVTSGLLALATFTFHSGIKLVKTVQSFGQHESRVRELEEEAGSLTAILGSLTETIGANTDIDLSALELPLRQCGHACNQFVKEIVKYSSRSGGSRTSFRDWAKLRYMGDDIDGFRRLLAGYKSTIIIALTDANLQVSVFLYIQSSANHFFFWPVANQPSLPKALNHTETLLKMPLMICRLIFEASMKSLKPYLDKQ